MDVTGLNSDFFLNSRQSFASYDWTTMPSSQEEKIVTHKFEHSLFNLFNRLFYQLNFHTGFILVITCITHFQSLFGNTMFTDDTFYNYIVTILEFTQTSGMTPSDFYIFGYIFVAITIAIYAMILGTNWYLWKRSSISNVLLILISISVFVICPLMINPTSYLAKRLLGFILIMSSYLKSPDNSTHIYFLSNNRNDDYEINKNSITRSDVNLLIILLVFLIIALILQCILIYYSFKLLSMTIYIPYHPLTGLSTMNVFYQLYFQPIIRFFEMIFAFYPQWVLYILHVLKVVLFALSLVVLFLMPLIHSVMNSLMFAFSIAGTVVSIIKLIFIQHQSDIHYIHYVSIILSYIIVAPIIFFGIRAMIKKKYKPLLAYDGQINISEMPIDKRLAIVKSMKNSNKDELISIRVFVDGGIVPPNNEDNNQFKYSIHNISTRLQLLFFIKAGIENGCDLFIDYTLFNFIQMVFGYDRQLLELLLIFEMGFPEMRFFSPRILGNLKTDKMSFDERFLMFEINKLQMITETESSTSSNEEINMARINSSQYQDLIMQSWYLDKLSLSALENVTSTVNKGQNLWDMIIIKYPNLIEAHALYLNFLTECKTDFYQASQIKRKLTKIQEHQLNKQDKCFIAMMQTFPFYITHNILTINGTLLDYANLDSKELYNDNEDLVNETENLNEISDYDTIAKSFLTLPKLRLAVYKATHNLKPSSSYYFQFIIYFFFIVFLAAEITLTAVYYTSPNDGMSNSHILRCYRYLASNISLATSYLLMKYGSSISKSELQTRDYRFVFNFFDYYTYNNTNMFFETNRSTLDLNLFNTSMNIFTSFQGLIDQIQELDSLSQYDVQPIINNLFKNPINLSICYEAVPINPISQDLEQCVIFFAKNTLSLAQGVDGVMNWFVNDNEFCNVFSFYQYLCEILIESRTNTFDQFMKSNLKQQDELLLISMLISIIIGVIFLIVFLIVSLRFLRELRVFVSILSSFDEDIKRTGTVPISLPEAIPQYMRSAQSNDNIDGEDKNFIPVRYRSKKGVYYFLIFFCCLLIVIQCIFIFFIGYTAYQMSHLILNVTFWSFYNRLRIPQFLELFSSLSLAIILQTNPSNATNYNRERLHALNVIQAMEEANYQLVATTDSGDSILGYYEPFDNYYLESTCTLSSSISFLSESYDYLNDNLTLFTDEEFQCMSMSHKVLVFIQVARDILQKIEKNVQSEALNKFIVSRISDLYYYMNKYLCYNIQDGDTLINQINSHYVSFYQRQMLLLMIFAIILSIISFFSAYRFKGFLESIFHGGIILVRRLNPDGIAANHRMITFLLNKEIETKSSKKQMPVTQSIMYHSQNMIFYLTNEGIIEGVNDQAIITNLSYSSDQILGKPIQSLVDEESKKEIQKQLASLEKNDQGISEINVIMYTAAMTDIYASMLMLRTSSSHIIAIVTNQNETMEKQKIAQEMKDNSLALLNHILPPYMVNKLNKNEKELSFTVPLATILMVDISHFTELSRTLSPEQILGTLSTIFNMFEKKMEDYVTITKIKTIGDIYICCGGLFGVPKDLMQMDHKIKSSVSETLPNASDMLPKTKISASLSSAAAFNLPILNPFTNFGPNSDLGPNESKALSKSNQPAHGSLTNIDFKLNLPVDNPNEPNQNEPKMTSGRITPNTSDFGALPQTAVQNADAFVANQVIHFALDIIELLDDLNMKNNTSLSLRLGVSTGGPIIAGLLGADLLDFEIFGDEIEIAERLEQVGIPGKIVICENTYNLISNYDYSIDARSDVYMKGKGTIHAYLVNSETSNYSQSS